MTTTSIRGPDLHPRSNGTSTAPDASTRATESTADRRDPTRTSPRSAAGAESTAAPPPQSASAPARAAPHSGTCRVLLICDDDLAGAELRRVLGDEIVADQVLGQGRERRLALEIDEVVLRGTWEIGVRDHRYHLCIVATTGASPLLVLAGNPVLRANAGAVLYLVDAAFDAVAAAKDRRPADRVLPAPFTSQALRAEVERLLLGVVAAEPAMVDDGQYLDFLSSLVKAGQRSLRPLLATGGCGHGYPLVAHHFGPGSNQPGILERLVELGIARRVVAQRLRTCPACAGHQLVWGEVCVRCDSPDFARETIIHHFACAHMDTEAAYTLDGALVCPKCRKTLRQIGRDYEKPTGCYRCRACSFIATETRVHASCQSCQARSTPDQVSEVLLHSYELTAKADEVVRAKDLGGHHMASVLRNRETGLYAKSFFLYTLQRELDRRRRYATPVALVAVRAGFLAALRLTSLERYGDEVAAVWKAATGGLRNLDVPCVWEEGVLAILLPGTPLAGAEVVARRIEQAFADHPDADGAAAVLALAAVEAGDGHADAEALVNDAVGRLVSDGSAISLIGVPGTDGSAISRISGSADGLSSSSEVVVIEDEDSHAQRTPTRG